MYSASNVKTNKNVSKKLPKIDQNIYVYGNINIEILLLGCPLHNVRRFFLSAWYVYKRIQVLVFFTAY
jgi:hypothetical protein